MECKCSLHIIFFNLCNELIDTLWNVNLLCLINNKSPDKELIDTLWNVNVLYLLKASHVSYELIDTLWNVNNGGKRAQREAEKRINRYIMECKFLLDPMILPPITELIDTLWNVNFLAPMLYSVIPLN